MPKAKYYFNTNSLKYEKVVISWGKRILRALGFLATAVVFSVVIVVIAYAYLDSPKEKQLKREINQLTLQYEILQQRFDQVGMVLQDLQHRDDNIYRVIFEAEPIPGSIREAGYGGIDKYKALEGTENADLIIETTRKLDKLTKQMYVQSKSFDEIVELAKDKSHMLASIPAIQPVANKDLTRIASGFGYRIHPIYKTTKFHEGLDFSAPVGTDIYATGNGIVKVVEIDSRGYGNHVIISHGFGYETLYGHMSQIKVRNGQKVKRGDIIGVVGSTGTSTAPHLHYEVIKQGTKINPINFFYNDLTAEEYEKMIVISSQSNQSFD
ncbi:MAG TPA: M23 family metallopeptidase [Bacteroidia bacterium]|nr:M23 family metallopeptidase [Bacteroidia bacterium]